MLKLSFPEEESEHEPDALERWDGRGAVRLLERDDARAAMLLERVRPGSPLWGIADDEEATVVAAEVLRRLHNEPVPRGHSFGSLADAAARWSETIPSDWRAAGSAARTGSGCGCGASSTRSRGVSAAGRWSRACSAAPSC